MSTCSALVRSMVIGQFFKRVKARTGPRVALVVAASAAVTLGLVSPASAQWCDPVEKGRIHADDAMVDDFFGSSVAIDGDTALIGASGVDDSADLAGAAYIFTRNGPGEPWTQQAKLIASDGSFFAAFGESVVLSGDTAVIGAGLDGEVGLFAGAVYVFTRSGGLNGPWTEAAKLIADDEAALDFFGFSVALSGDTMVVGSNFDDDNGSGSGSAYIFTRDPGTGIWTQQAKLLPADGAAGDQFGSAVAIDGDTVVIGTPFDGDGDDSGSAYVFTRSGGTWTQETKFVPADSIADTEFGNAVSIDGNTAVIAAHFDRDNGFESGSVYIFTRDGGIGGVWSETIKLKPDDAISGAQFGTSVAINEDTVVIGADRDRDENSVLVGSVYVFTRSGGQWWTQQGKFLSSVPGNGSKFGAAVGLDGNTAIVGARSSNSIEFGAGEANVFDLACEPCLTDMNNDGRLDFFDLQTFLALFSADDPAADLDNDGVLDFFDVQEYLNLYAAGCP